MKENIVVFCAHNDDQIIGAGGTLAKYARAGKDVYTVIFSYGEGSHPHIKREVAVQMRVKESLRAAKILGGKPNLYLGLREGHFADDIRKEGVGKRIKSFLKGQKPGKIFTHSIDDPHPDHKAVYHFVTKLLEELNYKGDVYSFDVWNPINIRKRNMPKMVVDISDTFKTKLKAMGAHRSQKVARFSLWWNLYLKSYYNGLNNGVRQAEVFYKIR